MAEWDWSKFLVGMVFGTIIVLVFQIGMIWVRKAKQ